MYLFLAVPNYCGSTLLHNLLETCPNVVSLTDPDLTPHSSDEWRKHFVEGTMIAPSGYRNLFGPHSIEANMEHVYSDQLNYDWPYIKQEWDKNWKHKNPGAIIRMQKTPTDIFRIDMMTRYFPDTKWVISVRDPYAYVDGILRNAPFLENSIELLDQICFHVIRVMELQLENKSLLGNNAYTVTYEDFCNNYEYHQSKMVEWLPELSGVQFGSRVQIKDKPASAIYNANEEKIAAMEARYPGIIAKITEYFNPAVQVINQWGYSLR